jgi:hypothetical protein
MLRLSPALIRVVTAWLLDLVATLVTQCNNDCGVGCLNGDGRGFASLFLLLVTYMIDNSDAVAFIAMAWCNSGDIDLLRLSS